MLEKSGQNDIWLIGQGTSYTALCWYPSCPRISSLREMQRQATVTKPLGIWVCANRLAQFVPLALRTYRASIGQSQGQALSLGTASVPPYHLLITETPWRKWILNNSHPITCCKSSCSEFTWKQHTHIHINPNKHILAQTYLKMRFNILLVNHPLTWKAHFQCYRRLNAFVLPGFSSL